MQNVEDIEEMTPALLALEAQPEAFARLERVRMEWQAKVKQIASSLPSQEDEYDSEDHEANLIMFFLRLGRLVSRSRSIKSRKAHVNT